MLHTQDAPVPTGFQGPEIVKAIRKAVLSAKMGHDHCTSKVVLFKAYSELSAAGSAPSDASVKLRERLSSSGVTLADTPQVSNHKSSDNFMLASDMMTFALDYPAPARIVLISDDVGLAYHLSTLHGRGYQVVLAIPGPLDESPSALRHSADAVFQHQGDVLPGKRKDKRSRAKSRKVQKPNSESVLTQEDLPKGPVMDQPSASNFKGLTEYYTPLMKILVSLSPDSTLVHRGINMRDSGPKRQLRSKVSSAMRAKFGVEVFGQAGYDHYILYAAKIGFILLGRGSHANSEWIELDLQHPLVVSYFKPKGKARRVQAKAVGDKFGCEHDAVHTYLPLVKALHTMPIDDRMVSIQGIDTNDFGCSRQLRSKVAQHILNYDSLAYQKAGKKGWSAYADEAQKLGIIRLGSDPTLRIDWAELVNTHPVINSFRRGLRMGTELEASGSPTTKTKWDLADEQHRAFAPLVTTLLRMPVDTTLPSRGISMRNASKTRQLLSTTSTFLSRLYPSVYNKAGVLGWTEYAQQAQELGVIRLGYGSTLKTGWVELVDDHSMVMSLREGINLQQRKQGGMVSTPRDAPAIVTRPQEHAQGSAHHPQTEWTTVDHGHIDKKESWVWKNHHTNLWLKHGNKAFMLNGIRVRGKYALLVRILQDQRRISRTSHVPFVYGQYIELQGPVFGSPDEFAEQHLEEAHMDHIVELWPRYRNVNHYEQHVVLHKRLCSPDDAVSEASPQHVKPFDPYVDEVDKDASSSHEEGDTSSSEGPLGSSTTHNIGANIVKYNSVISRNDARDIDEISKETSPTAKRKGRSKEGKSVLPDSKVLIEFDQWRLVPRKLNGQKYPAKFKCLVWLLYDAQIQWEHPRVTDSMWVFDNLRRLNDSSFGGKSEDDAKHRWFPLFLAEAENAKVITGQMLLGPHFPILIHEIRLHERFGLEHDRHDR